MGIVKEIEIVPSGDCAPLASPLCDDEAIRNLLDVISSIIADEYIEIAKKNPDIFRGEK